VFIHSFIGANTARVLIYIYRERERGRGRGRGREEEVVWYGGAVLVSECFVFFLVFHGLLLDQQQKQQHLLYGASLEICHNSLSLSNHAAIFDGHSRFRIIYN